jgi:hypothetical protein
MLLLIENSRSCAGKWLHNNRLWFCSWEFTTLKGINRDGQTPVCTSPFTLPCSGVLTKACNNLFDLKKKKWI